METKIPHIDLSHIQHLPMIDFIGNDFAIFDNIKDIPFPHYPSRLGVVCLYVCLKGEGTMWLNLQEYKVEAGMMGVILPEQIIQQGRYSDDFSGLFIVVSKDFVDGILPTMQKLFPVFLLVKDHPCIHITSEEEQSFCQYHSFLRSKVRQQGHPFRREVAQGLLLSLFYEIYGIYLQRNLEVKGPENLQEEQFRQFMRLVTEHCKQERSVSFYAGEMCLSSKHLSAVVKRVSGRTAGEWIDSLVVLEAKVMLKSSEASIQEIAEELHFANQSFFGKYFKQHAGMSPKAYRKQQVGLQDS